MFKDGELTDDDISANLVEVVDVVKAFDGHQVLRGLSFSARKGETLVVMGGSGSGKTVLLRLIAGLLRPDRGRITVFGRSIERLSEEELLPIRRRIDLTAWLTADPPSPRGTPISSFLNPPCVTVKIQDVTPS